MLISLVGLACCQSQIIFWLLGTLLFACLHNFDFGVEELGFDIILIEMHYVVLVSPFTSLHYNFKTCRAYNVF